MLLLMAAGRAVDDRVCAVFEFDCLRLISTFSVIGNGKMDLVRAYNRYASGDKI